MKRPSVEASLKPLKAFQRRTVEHAFHRLFTADDSTGRFLVADEVGLGKTLVARGIIARAIDHLWNDVERIDIVYICSNGSIALANLPKLQVGGVEQRSFALATRLTMLATELAHREGESGLAGSKLNFVSFTPAHRSPGALGRPGPGAGGAVSTARSAGGNAHGAHESLAGMDHEEGPLAQAAENNPRPIDDTIRQSFEAAFHERPDLRRGCAAFSTPHSAAITRGQPKPGSSATRSSPSCAACWPARASRRSSRSGHPGRVPALQEAARHARNGTRSRGGSGAGAVPGRGPMTANAYARSCFPRHRTSSTPRTRRSSTRSTTRISWPPRGSCSATTTPASKR